MVGECIEFREHDRIKQQPIEFVGSDFWMAQVFSRDAQHLIFLNAHPARRIIGAEDVEVMVRPIILRLLVRLRVIGTCIDVQGVKQVNRRPQGAYASLAELLCGPFFGESIHLQRGKNRTVPHGLDKRSGVIAHLFRPMVIDRFGYRVKLVLIHGFRALS